MGRPPGYSVEVTKLFDDMIKSFCSKDVDAPSIDNHTNPNSSEKEVGLNDDFKIKIELELEVKLVHYFLLTPCSCHKNCKKSITFDELLGNRQRISFMEKESRDFMILQLLRQCCSNESTSSSGRRRHERQRNKFNYKIGDSPVCKNTFLFYYNETQMGLQRIQNSINDFSSNCLFHGNKAKKPSNITPEGDTLDAILFIKNYAAIYGLPDPGRDIRKGKGKLRILLPSILNYQKLHTIYQNSLKASQKHPISYRLFIELWQKECAYIQFQGPRTDLCYTCEEFKKKINQTTSILNEEREELLRQIYNDARDHLIIVHKERIFYKANIQVAKKYYNASDKEGSRKINGPKMSHYSWDFAQQLSYPFEDQQVGPIFFKTPKRAQLFGICNEGAGVQTNYLIDEGQFDEKNANMTISILDHYFTHYGRSEKYMHLSADNCVGQNKNNALIHYLLYRILTGKQTQITLSFLIVGHTKFSPDAHFGLIKKTYRHSKVYTLDQLAEIIKNSSEKGFNQAHISNQETGLVYRDWVGWLSKYFKPLKGISKYHHFKFSKALGESIEIAKLVDMDSMTINLGKKPFPFKATKPPKKLPKPIAIEGLTPKRQWYLYDKIREHIPDSTLKDITCPLPGCPRPQDKNEDDASL